MLTDLLCELERSGKRFGLQTVCEATGTANATISGNEILLGADEGDALLPLVGRRGALSSATPRSRLSFHSQ